MTIRNNTLKMETLEYTGVNKAQVNEFIGSDYRAVPRVKSKYNNMNIILASEKDDTENVLFVLKNRRVIRKMNGRLLLECFEPRKPTGLSSYPYLVNKLKTEPENYFNIAKSYEPVKPKPAAKVGSSVTTAHTPPTTASLVAGGGYIAQPQSLLPKNWEDETQYTAPSQSLIEARTEEELFSERFEEVYDSDGFYVGTREKTLDSPMALWDDIKDDVPSGDDSPWENPSWSPAWQGEDYSGYYNDTTPVEAFDPTLVDDTPTWIDNQQWETI